MDTKNLWFRTIARKRCLNCGNLAGEVVSCGEYIRAKWRNVANTCSSCWPTLMQTLNSRIAPAQIKLVGYRNQHAPKWMTTDDTKTTATETTTH